MHHTMARTLWQKLPIFIGITLCLTLAAASTTQSPPSNCRCLSDGTTTCRLAIPADYMAFPQLGNKTVSLRLVIKGSFRADLADFSKLGGLENLTFTADRRYFSYEDAVQDNALNAFIRLDLFQNLTNLRRLSISLVLKSFDSALLAPFRQLKGLSFSYAYLYDFKDFINIADHTGTHLLTVQEFRMIAVQRIITPDTMIRLKEHIYEPLQHLPLKILDLSYNKAVLVQMGLPAYLPNLEVFRVGALGVMIFQSTLHCSTCNLAEVMMHANLREFELSFPEKATMESTYNEGNESLNTENDSDKLLYCIQHLNLSSDICGLANCICEGLAKIPCQPYGKLIHIYDIIVPPKKGNPSGICVPPPPSLETFVYRNYPSVAVPHSLTLCFNPANWSNIVRYGDVSSDDLKFLQDSP